MGLDKANLIATIIGTVYPSGPPDYLDRGATTALAVQFAIWEIVHETLFDKTAPNFGLDVLLGNASFFRENGGGANADPRRRERSHRGCGRAGGRRRRT